MPRIHKARRAPTVVADLWATRRVCFQTHQRRASQREASPAAKGRDETVASQTRPSTIHYPREANGFPCRAARVVEWQTRTFEGRMPKGMRVQVPPRAPIRALRAVALPVASYQYGIALSCRPRSARGFRVCDCNRCLQIFHDVAPGPDRKRARQHWENDRHEPA